MKHNKTLLLLLSLIGIHQLHGADDVPLTVMIGNDRYELPTGSHPFVAQHYTGSPVASNTRSILALLQTHKFLNSIFAYDPKTNRVETIKRVPVITQERYLELCNSNPTNLRIYAIKCAGGGLFGIRFPAKEKREIRSEMCSVAVLSGYANFYLNKRHYTNAEIFHGRK